MNFKIEFVVKNLEKHRRKRGKRLLPAMILPLPTLAYYVFKGHLSCVPYNEHCLVKTDLYICINLCSYL